MQWLSIPIPQNEVTQYSEPLRSSKRPGRSFLKQAGGWTVQLYPRPLLEAVGKDARQGRAAVEGAALRHQLDDTVAVLNPVRVGSSGASPARC